MRKLLGWCIAVYIAAGLTQVNAEDDALGGMTKSVSQIFYGLRELAPKTNATANLTLTDTSKETKAKSTIPGRFWMTDKGMVWQIESTGMTYVSAAHRNLLRQMQLDQVRMVLLFEPAIVYAIYPKAKAYIESKVPDSVAQPKPGTGKRVGEPVEELVNGHACKRFQFRFEHKDNLLFSLWCATDLADFPIKVAEDSQKKSFDAVFTMVSFGPPDETMMSLPAGFKRYESLNALVENQRSLIKLK